MQTSQILYNVEKSSQRLDGILSASNSGYEEINYIPDRSKLTFTNGYYINVGAIFVDIRKSSELPNEHKRPKLAKLYRSYISEVVAILNGYYECKEVNIVGDCVSGIFEATLKPQIERMIDAAAQINSLIKILNYKFRKNGIVEISVGIGIAFGRVLMVKAGYSGSSINDVVWMGEVVNEASNLCNQANKSGKQVILINDAVFSNLSKNYSKWFTKTNYELFYSCYQGDVINLTMDEWYNKNCK